MKEIPLTQGKVALVDDEDYDFLINYNKWSCLKVRNTFYAKSSKNYKLVLMHKLIMGSSGIVDHKDRNGLNNQRSNLRFATVSQNRGNTISIKNSSSQYLGVSLDKHKRKWQARITKDGKGVYLGLFKEETEAALAYNKAALEIYGEFANLNSVPTT